MGKRTNLTKKEAKVQIHHALSSLMLLKSAIGEKKFSRRLQKAERILSNGLPKKKKRSGEHQLNEPAA